MQPPSPAFYIKYQIKNMIQNYISSVAYLHKLKWFDFGKKSIKRVSKAFANLSFFFCCFFVVVVFVFFNMFIRTTTAASEPWHYHVYQNVSTISAALFTTWQQRPLEESVFHYRNCSTTHPTKLSVRPAKAVQSRVFAVRFGRKLRFLATQKSHSEDWSDWLKWVFAGRKCRVVGFVVLRLKILRFYRSFSALWQRRNKTPLWI